MAPVEASRDAVQQSPQEPIIPSEPQRATEEGQPKRRPRRRYPSKKQQDAIPTEEPTQSADLEAAPSEETTVARPMPHRRRRPMPIAKEAATETPVEASPQETIEVEFDLTLPTGPRRGGRRNPRERQPIERRKPLEMLAPSRNRIGMRNGLPALVLNNTSVPPLLFFGNINSNATEKHVLNEIQKAAAAGVHVHILLLDLIVDEQSLPKVLDDAAYMIKRVVEADPQANIFWRVVFTPASGWRQRYPDAVCTRADGTQSEPSISSEAWWQYAAKCLEHLVLKMRTVTEGERVVGYHLERGEWFYGSEEGYDTSPAAREAFRRWTKHYYNNDVVMLRSAWSEGNVSFNTVEIPTYHPISAQNSTSILDSRKDRRIVDFHLFLSDAVAERLADLARMVKHASKNQALVAVSYGYTFEWSHPNSGHLSLGQVTSCPYIDIIAGPPSYSDRLPTQAGTFPMPIDSIALRGKLYLSEEDFKTPLASGNEPDDYNLQISQPYAMDQVHLRGLGVTLTHGSGAAWMDLWGEGWLDSSVAWQRAADYREWWRIQIESPPAPPDVAVIVDEGSIAHARDRELLRAVLKEQQANILRSGMSVGFYLLSDLMLKNFPECQLYIFLNAWDISAEQRAIIRERLHKNGKTLTWLYAAGLYENHKPALENAREVTGIALKQQPFASKPGSRMLSRRHPLAEFMDDPNIQRIEHIDPTFYSITEDATTVGEYQQTGLPSMIVREYEQSEVNGKWRAVYLGEPTLPPALLRGLGSMAKVHIWSNNDDVIHVRLPFLVIHAKRAGQRTINFPSSMSAYNLEDRQIVTENSVSARLYMEEGQTVILLVAPQEQLQRMLSTQETGPVAAPESIRVPEVIVPLPPEPAIIHEPKEFFGDALDEEYAEIETVHGPPKIELGRTMLDELVDEDLGLNIKFRKVDE